MKNPKSKSTFRRLAGLILVIAMFASLTAGCASPAKTVTGNDATTAAAAAASGLSGQIIVDGSSTVFPITEAVSEEFTNANPGVQIPVGFAGTGGGFKKFIANEIDIANASRPIKTEEADALKAAGIGYTEFKIGYDGLTVVVNAANDWASDMTVDELKMIWQKDSTVTKWSDVRAGWPAEKINLYGPGTDSGTFEYFTEVINGKKAEININFTPSEDDNVLVQGVAGDKYAMGYFGYAYYEANADKLIDVAVNGVAPSFDTIKDGSYKPLSRPLYMYVKNSALARPEVKAFVNYFLTEGTKLVGEVGYVPLTDDAYKTELAKLG
jgi:phosphate transport system substrate-binding protein